MNLGQQPDVVAIDCKEHELRTRAKHRDARWSKLKKVSLMNYSTAVALGVSDRIFDGFLKKRSIFPRAFPIVKFLK